MAGNGSIKRGRLDAYASPARAESRACSACSCRAGGAVAVLEAVRERRAYRLNRNEFDVASVKAYASVMI